MNKDNEEDYYIDGQHYDNMVKSRSLFESVPFYVNKAKKYGGPVLDLACGTGRMTIPIAKEGLSVVGLDISAKMLDQAKRNAKKEHLKIEWIEADMTNFNLGKKFSLILIPADAVNWVLENRSIENCLSCVKRHLKKNGKFIFNVFNPDLEILQRDPSNVYPMFEYPNPDGEGYVIVSESNTYDKATQINYVNSYHKIGEKEIIKKLNLRMYFPQELDALLYYNGFIIDHKYGNFNQKPFTSDSNHQIVICHASASI